VLAKVTHKVTKVNQKLNLSGSSVTSMNSAKIGIIVGAIVAILALIGVGFLLFIKRNRQRQQNPLYT
jgi:flagellar biogenesis protein FliO